MKGLSKKIQDKTKRSQHILTNMFYMIEINSSSVQELHKLFGKDANISNADFLDNKKKWEKDLGQTQFDIVVGNPPFQVSKSNKYEGSVGNRTLWDKFLDKTYKENTYISTERRTGKHYWVHKQDLIYTLSKKALQIKPKKPI